MDRLRNNFKQEEAILSKLDRPIVVAGSAGVRIRHISA